MKERIELRAHHGMCLLFFEGKGYSEGFTAHMQTVLEHLMEDTPLRIVVKSDIVCSRCPNLKESVCTTADKVSAYDIQVLKECGLEENAESSWGEFRRRVEDKILRAGKRESICGNCQWAPICREKEIVYAGKTTDRDSQMGRLLGDSRACAGGT